MFSNSSAPEYANSSLRNCSHPMLILWSLLACVSRHFTGSRVPTIGALGCVNAPFLMPLIHHSLPCNHTLRNIVGVPMEATDSARVAKDCLQSLVAAMSGHVSIHAIVLTGAWQEGQALDEVLQYLWHWYPIFHKFCMSFETAIHLNHGRDLKACSWESWSTLLNVIGDYHACLLIISQRGSEYILE